MIGQNHIMSELETDIGRKQETKILPLGIKEVSLEISGRRFIKDISTEFSRGGVSVIIGPNGAGKSLFLKLCHGIITPTSGEVVWKGFMGRDCKKYQAMMFQRPTILRRSVIENLLHPLKCRKVMKSERELRVRELLDQTGLSRLARVSARKLSVGEQQRLALARAWLLRPEVLFLDEPSASLDPSGTHALEGIIHTIEKSGTKVIMTTQDLGQAKRLGRDILFLYRGRLLERATASKFFDSPENDLAQAFLKGELLWWNRKDLTPPKGLN